MEKTEEKTDEVLSPLEQKVAKYREQNYNVLLPSQSIQQFGHFHEPSVEVVQLDASQGSGDVYVQTWKKDERGEYTIPKDFSLAKPALLKLATCAGIVWDMINTKRVDDGHDRNYVCYQAVGSLQRSDGRWIPLKNMYEVDIEVIREELVDQYTKKCKGWNQTEEYKADWIKESVRRDVLKKRKHKLRLAESGAMMAVIRSLLAIKSHYTKEELEKPFVVPRVVFNPDTEDPEIRKAILTEGKAAMRSAYGPDWEEQFPTSTPIDVPALPATNPMSEVDEDEEIETSVEAALEKQREEESKQPDKEPEKEPVKEEKGPIQTEPIEAPPFEEAKTEEAPPIMKLEEFKALHNDPEKVAATLERLMKRVNYDEDQLTNRKIADWKWEHQEKFFNVLIGMADQV
jgi:hypothetical protein